MFKQTHILKFQTKATIFANSNGDWPDERPTKRNENKAGAKKWFQLSSGLLLGLLIIFAFLLHCLLPPFSTFSAPKYTIVT